MTPQEWVDADVKGMIISAGLVAAWVIGGWIAKAIERSGNGKEDDRG